MVDDARAEEGDNLYLAPMNDEWRLETDTGASGNEVVQHLASRGLEHDLSEAFGDTVIVSRDDDTVFIYAGSREQAEVAGSLVAKLCEREGWTVATRLTRWHPDAEEWKDADEPLPVDPDSRRAEHAEAIADERAEVAASGEPRFEVRVDLDSHRDAAGFAERLEAEGLPVVRRWRYLVVGAEDEDAAKALAERLRGEAPAGSEVSVEGSGRIAWEERPPNPFAIFGGLGG